jgi:hypothetical protein
VHTLQCLYNGKLVNNPGAAHRYGVAPAGNMAVQVPKFVRAAHIATTCLSKGGGRWFPCDGQHVADCLT